MSKRRFGSTEKEVKGRRGKPYFTLTELLLIAVLAALGLATKWVVYPLVSMVSAPLYLPAGSIAGGIYMIWLVVARGVVNRPGAALACALVQGFAAFLTPFGKHGAWTFLIYVAPGAMVELVMLVSRHGACCVGCASVAGAFANMVGSALVSYIILAATWELVLFATLVGGVSGGLGGPIAFALLSSIWKVFPETRPDNCRSKGKSTGG